MSPSRCDDRTYTWDAESRLSSVTFNDPIYGNRQLRFGYDYLGRRVWRRLCDWGWNGCRYT